MKHRIAALALISLCALSSFACSSMSLKTNLAYDKNANFGSYKTFAFEGRGIKDPYWAGIIEASITAEFRKKGVSPSDRNPDLLVSYDASLALGDETSRVYSSGVAYSTGTGWTTMAGAGLVTTIDMSVGTFVVELADPKKKEIVWRATASHDIDKNASLDTRASNLSGGIAKMFEGYPPGK